jgi:maltose alpha-D-glucosyltransferase/alpha-amylase
MGSILLFLEGPPLIVYGDEIGIGDDLSQHGRNSVRVPMQWSAEKNGGFSTANTGSLCQPMVSQGPFSFKQVNVADQQEDPEVFAEHRQALYFASQGPLDLHERQASDG